MLASWGAGGMDDIQVFQFICAAFTIYLYKFPLFFSSPILPLVPSMLVSLPRHPSLHILQHLFSLVLTLLCESFGGPLVAMSGAPSFFVWLKVTEPTTKKVVQFCSATFPVQPAPPRLPSCGARTPPYVMCFAPSWRTCPLSPASPSMKSQICAQSLAH